MVLAALTRRRDQGQSCHSAKGTNGSICLAFAVCIFFEKKRILYAEAGIRSAQAVVLMQLQVVHHQIAPECVSELYNSRLQWHLVFQLELVHGIVDSKWQCLAVVQRMMLC